MTCNILLFSLIFCNKELQAQPNKILMWIALAEFTECYNFVIMDLICELNLPRIFLISTFQEVTSASIKRAIAVIVKSGSTISGMGFRFTSILNLGLCLDVSLTLRYPFKQR